MPGLMYNVDDPSRKAQSFLAQAGQSYARMDRKRPSREPSGLEMAGQAMGLVGQGLGAISSFKTMQHQDEQHEITKQANELISKGMQNVDPSKIRTASLEELPEYLPTIPEDIDESKYNPQALNLATSKMLDMQSGLVSQNDQWLKRKALESERNRNMITTRLQEAKVFNSQGDTARAADILRGTMSKHFPNGETYELLPGEGADQQTLRAYNFITGRSQDLPVNINQQTVDQIIDRMMPIAQSPEGFRQKTIENAMVQNQLKSEAYAKPTPVKLGDKTYWQVAIQDSRGGPPRISYYTQRPRKGAAKGKDGTSDDNYLVTDPSLVQQIETQGTTAQQRKDQWDIRGKRADTLKKEQELRKSGTSYSIDGIPLEVFKEYPKEKKLEVLGVNTNQSPEAVMKTLDTLFKNNSKGANNIKSEVSMLIGRLLSSEASSFMQDMGLPAGYSEMPEEEQEKALQTMMSNQGTSRLDAAIKRADAAGASPQTKQTMQYLREQLKKMRKYRKTAHLALDAQNSMSGINNKQSAQGNGQGNGQGAGLPTQKKRKVYNPNTGTIEAQ